MHETCDILGHYPADCRPRHVDALGAAGGMSGAQFWRVTAPRGVLILRRWPVEHPTPERLQFIHAVLGHAAPRDTAFLPLPILTTGGKSFVSHAGHLWELAPWMPGTADFSTAPSKAKLRAAMAALAKFHTATADFDVERFQAGSLMAATEFTSAATQWVAGYCAAPAISHRLARLRELQSGGAEVLARAITRTTWPDLAPLAREFVTALPAAIRPAVAQLAPLAETRFSLQPCLRDIWHDHVLFTGDVVTGIVDFGAADIDTPATDIARLLGSLVGDDRDGRQTGLIAYSAVRPLSEHELRAVAALDISGTILAGCNWIRWIYVDGRQFENRAQVLARFRNIMAQCTPHS